MNADVKREGRWLAFMRFGLCGLVFTVLGPTIFWIAYPLGVFIAIAIAELCVHSLRFLAFRIIVFPVEKGYRVNLTRYVLSALPVTLACVAIVTLLTNRLGRTELTLAGALFSLLIGFIWSRFVYTKRPAKQ